eukprot:GHVR01090791.1.p1 GENE.GHVR01090791.1~~GHVR01090791.1.p1  ORF type:complete len:123 (+),score=5.62 GHVR01090791.1:33-401(+)
MEVVLITSMLKIILVVCSSWDYVHQLTLQRNMRAYVHGDHETGTFSDLLLQIGDGRITVNDYGFIDIPHGWGNIVKDSIELESCVYPDFINNYTNWLCERAILCCVFTCPFFYWLAHSCQRV